MCKKKHTFHNKRNRRKYAILQVKSLTVTEKIFLKVVRRYLFRQMDRVIASLDNRVKSYTKGLEDEVFALELEVKLAKDEFLPWLERVLIEAGQSAVLFQGSEYAFNLTSGLLSTLEKRSELFARTINATTFKKLRTEFAESIELGEDRNKLIKRIENTYGEIAKGRAATIARTEIGVATQTGTFEGYKQAGATIKIWAWAPGVMGGIRDNHQAMDGEEQQIDHPFSNGLMYPLDPSGPAKETINCACTI